ncbi:MAG: hypothetical protein ACXV3A_11635 [Kineosporiaceae bacterium]
MSRPTSQRPASIPGHAAPGRRGPGRHRIDRPSGVRVTDLPAVRERLMADRRQSHGRNAFMRWLLPTAPSGRHTWNFLAMAGGRPRTAFAIILSL